MDSTKASTLRGLQTIPERLLPMIRAATPTAMQVILLGSVPPHKTCVSTPLGLTRKVSSRPVLIMDGKSPVIPLPNNSVR